MSKIGGEYMQTKARPFEKVEYFIMSWTIIGITAVMIFNVVARYLFNRSWTPTEEICLILVIVSTFTGCNYAARKGEHLFVSLIFDIPMIPKGFKRALAAIISGVCSVSCVIIGWYGVQYVIGNYLTGRTTPSLGIPMYIIYIAFPAGFFMMAFQFIRSFIKNVKDKDYYLGPEMSQRGVNQ